MTDSTLQPTYGAEIEGKRLAVFDDLLPKAALEQLTGIMYKSGFTRSEVARPDVAAFRHWATEIPVEALTQLPIWEPTQRALAQFIPERRYKPYRSYVNANFYGDMLFTHTDCLPGSDELTALWYVSTMWDHEWGGETLFFDSHNDARAVVSPRPGRLAIFNGNLTHAGRPPSRICVEPRFTLALKLQPLV